MESTLTAKGQATIPKAVRERLGLKPGDKVKFFAMPDGNVAILPVLPVTALRGIVKPLGRPVTLEEMDDAIAEASIERDKASRGGKASG
jgi:AbrB family looped-hinge helix DNA binding protein